jgi:hypothetical protein
MSPCCGDLVIPHRAIVHQMHQAPAALTAALPLSWGWVGGPHSRSGRDRQVTIRDSNAFEL